MSDRPLQHPAQLLTAVHELDKLRVGLRLARPSDAPRVRAFLECLSPEARTRRFATPIPRVPSRLVHHFTFPDGRTRWVILATAPLEGTERVVGIADPPLEGTERVVGIADLALLRPRIAEVALVVSDEVQGRGIGRLLAQAAAAVAARRGARRLRAEIGLGGPAAYALMKGLGPTMTTVEGGSPVAYTTLRLPSSWRDDRPDDPLEGQALERQAG